jgi:hypothetical protein
MISSPALRGSETPSSENTLRASHRPRQGPSAAPRRPQAPHLPSCRPALPRHVALRKVLPRGNDPYAADCTRPQECLGYSFAGQTPIYAWDECPIYSVPARSKVPRRSDPREVA